MKFANVYSLKRFPLYVQCSQYLTFELDIMGYNENCMLNSQSHTAGADYLPVNETILFHPGGEKVVCLNISIDDDDIVEGFESFTLSLDVENGDLPAVEAVVYVLDNDCKCLSLSRAHTHTHTYTNTQ